MAKTPAERMNHFSGSPTSALIATVAELKRQGKNIISLNVGEPDFGTPDYIKVAGIKAIAENFTKYTPGNGILELRQEIIKKLREDNGVKYTLNEVTTAVGAKQAIASSLMVIAGPGDEVLLPVPCWVSYTEMIRLAGAEPVFVPVRSDNYELDIDAIERAITSRTKAIVICTPNNPTGAVYSEKDLRRLAELAVKHDFFIVADEIYEKLIYDGAKHFSVASISREVQDHTITVNGFSKAYSMTGWRLGYVCGPKPVISAMTKLHQYGIMSAPTTSQYAAIEALDHGDGDIEAMREEYDGRRRFLVDGFRKLGLDCFEPLGAFYTFPCIRSTGLSSEEFCDRFLAAEKVAVIPGSAFGPGGEGFVRACYAASMHDLGEALSRLERFLKTL